MFPKKRPCKIFTINQYSYLSHKSSYSTLLHNSEAKFFQHHQFFEKSVSNIFSIVSLSNHRIDSLTEQGQRSNDTNGTTVYEIFSCIFSFFSCGCCSWLLDVKSTQECEVFEKYAIKIRKTYKGIFSGKGIRKGVAQKAVMMAVDGGLISLDGSGRVCTQCHMMAPDQSRLTPNVFSDAVVSKIFGFDYSEGEK